MNARKNGPGQRLTEARIERKLTQAQVAALTGFTQPQVSDIETGKLELTPAQWQDLADAIKVEYEFLLVGRPEEDVVMLSRLASLGKPNGILARALIVGILDAIEGPWDGPLGRR